MFFSMHPAGVQVKTLPPEPEPAKVKEEPKAGSDLQKMINGAV